MNPLLYTILKLNALAFRQHWEFQGEKALSIFEGMSPGGAIYCSSL